MELNYLQNNEASINQNVGTELTFITQSLQFNFLVADHANGA